MGDFLGVEPLGLGVQGRVLLYVLYVSIRVPCSFRIGDIWELSQVLMLVLVRSSLCLCGVNSGGNRVQLCMCVVCVRVEGGFVGRKKYLVFEVAI